MAESLATPFVMHGARDAVAGGLTHVDQQVRSIEQAVAENPGLAFDLAKTLVESVCRTVLGERNIAFSEGDDRKGIKYLQDSGVTVHMFDRDLQEAIQVANEVFIEQALERAAAAKEEREPKSIVLSPLENAIVTAETKDLSAEALKQYRTVAKISATVGSPAFNRRLVQQGLLKQKNRLSTPTGFGLLLFGREPRTVMPQAGLLGTIHFGDGTEEPKDFDGPQVLAPEQALQWLRDKLPNPIDRSAARRRQANEALFELVREGVVNALVHRDYAIKGAKCQLVVTPDTITVKSPG